MSHSERLLNAPATFRRLTGPMPSAFGRLAGELAEADRGARDRWAARPDRRRAAGTGRKPALPLADALLIYYRTDVPHTFLGFLFGIDDSAVCRSNADSNRCWPACSASRSGASN